MRMGGPGSKGTLMIPAEFDDVATNYQTLHQNNIALSGESPEYFSRYKIRILLADCVRYKLIPHVILDFGSGIGSSVPHFKSSFSEADLVCIDISQRSLDLGEARFPGVARSVKLEGSFLPFEAHSFDVVFSACVFHHIPHEQHVDWLSELYRVTRPGGLLSVFEHNPFNPLTQHAVNTCPFDANARLIRAGQLRERCLAAGWSRLRVRFHVFLPRMMAILRPAERWLTRVPLGAQYSLIAIRDG